MAEWWEWTGEPGPWEANAGPAMWAGGSPWFDESGGNYWQSPAYQQFTGWGGDERQTGWYQNADLDTSGDGGGGNWLQSILSSLGPILSAGGSLAGGAIGSNASNDAARLQANALNRGMDLQTAQWLQQQANQAPWLQAGMQALPQLQQLAQQGAQAPFQPGASIDPRQYAMPDATPGWRPQGFQRPDVVDPNAYRYTPGEGPRASDYRYTPGAVPSAAQYRYTPGAVPTLQGAELLANDPGVQFRQDEARKALEASALARGSGMSGATLSALGRQSQDLASQEYGQAWNRSSQQAQMREGWAQTASQMGFGQAMDETRLREQVNQIASQQGWSQAQAEAAFREQLAQQASAQNFTQAQAAQQANFGQGMETARFAQGEQQAYAQQLYNQLMQQQQMRYGQDVAQNQTDYERQLAAYNSQTQNQMQNWNRWSALAGYGPQAAEQLRVGGQAGQSQLNMLLERLGLAQGEGAAGSALQWQRGITGATNRLPSILASLNS